MNHGNLTNSEILVLITSGLASVGDTAFSINWGQVLKFNGVVFQSACDCSYIGSYPICDQNNCESVKEAIGSFVALEL